MAIVQVRYDGGGGDGFKRPLEGKLIGVGYSLGTLGKAQIIILFV